MKQKLPYLLSFILVLFMLTAAAQDRRITGTVAGDDGAPLPGVSIAIKGTNVSTQTNAEGAYSITASQGAVLVYSFIGLKSEERTIGSSSVINVTLGADAASLDEVVIVGYGTQSKRTLTDNVAKLTSSDIAEIPSPGFQNTLSGKAAGVQITQTNGKVEGGISIRVRGVASISAGSEPLYVVDGMPLINSNESSTSAPTNPLLSISPNEIESIDILKDASATAIYGSRGANGVVIITTKSGKDGRNSFTANVAHGYSEPTNVREWLNTEQYIELFTEAAINRYGQTTGTEIAEDTFDFLAQGTDWRSREIDEDWQSLAFQQGRNTDADLSLSGGNKSTKYFFSGAYNNTAGIIRGNNLERITSRINISQDFSEKFTAGANLSFSKSDIDRISNDNAFTTPLQAIAQPALSPAYLENGEPNPNTLYANFLLQDRHAFYNTVLRRVTGKAFGEYRFLPYLKFNSDFGYDLVYQTEDQFVGSQAPFQSTNGEGYAATAGTESYIFTNYFTFNKNFNNVHNFEAVAGMEFNDIRRRFQSVTGIQFPSDDLITVRSAAEITAGDGTFTQSNFLSYFARATYSLYDRYLLKASIRRDGSSRFG